MNNRQSQAGSLALLLGGEKGLEDSVQMGRGDADPIV